jgi:hypothetical protein
MARSSECRDYYARKVPDTADIVRDACLQQLILLSVPPLQGDSCGLIGLLIVKRVYFFQFTVAHMHAVEDLIHAKVVSISKTKQFTGTSAATTASRSDRAYADKSPFPHQRLRRRSGRLPRRRHRFPAHWLAAVVTGLGIHDVRREDERQVRESLGEVPDLAV